ncbi:MAG: extracellular solute-binding protein [Clostridiales bacterium]|jgi:multiple sugar transport system substrate-binding protein|nr:extracellular solute-binding protein [Clostridiales bacterium]
MKKITRFFASILLVAMVILMVGCGASSKDTKDDKSAGNETASGSKETTTASSDKAEKESSGEKVTLKVQWIGDFKLEDSTDPISGETRKGVKILEEEFEKQNPDIDLEYIIMGWDDYQKKTQSMIMAGEADLYQAPGIAALAAQDLLEPLQPYIDKDNFDIGVYIDGQIDGWKVVGVSDSDPQIYGLPLIADTRFIVYDKQIFDEWGVPYLSAQPTLEEVMDCAKKMTGTNPVTGEQNYGIFHKGTDGGDTVMNINEYYGGTWGTGNTAAELVMNFDSDTMIKAMETLVELNKYAPEGVMVNQGGELFGTENNNIAINLRANPAVINNIEALGLSDRYAVSRLFINEEHGMGGMFAGSPIVMASNSKVKDAAWEYLKFTSSDFFAEYFWENQRNEGLPVIKNALKFDGIANNENISAIMDTLQYLWTPRYVYRAGEARGILTTAVEDVTLNGKSPAEVLSAAQKEVEEWIAAQ